MRLIRALRTFAQTILQNMFGLDLRSIALLRIALALCLLWVTYANACELRAFYTDDGVWTRAARIQNPGEFLGFSLYMADGSVPDVAAQWRQWRSR